MSWEQERFPGKPQENAWMGGWGGRKDPLLEQWQKPDYYIRERKAAAKKAKQRLLRKFPQPGAS